MDHHAFAVGVALLSVTDATAVYGSAHPPRSVRSASGLVKTRVNAIGRLLFIGELFGFDI
jgi:hypothetical protein